MGLLDFLFGDKKKQIAEFLEKDAVILDVRTKEEFNGIGHIKGSKCIPLQEISEKVNEIKSWNKPIIACCRSGNRSGMAKMILKRNGVEVMNGGGWQSLKNKIADIKG